MIDRSGTSAEKVEGLKHIWGRTDLIPLWVADMDFATAPFVTDAIRKDVYKRQPSTCAGVRGLNKISCNR